MEGLHSRFAVVSTRSHAHVRHRVGPAAGVLVVILLAACGAEEVEPPPSDVAHYVPKGGAGGSEAQLIGELVRDDDCTYVNSDGVITIPLFPADRSIRWEDDLLRIGNVQYQLETVVTFTGGEGTREAAGVSVPEGCSPDAPVFVVSTRSG